MEMVKEHVLWRSAFQAHRPRIAFPGTAYPVTIASLCSAFQARRYRIILPGTAYPVTVASLRSAFQALIVTECKDIKALEN